LGIEEKFYIDILTYGKSSDSFIMHSLDKFSRDETIQGKGPAYFRLKGPFLFGHKKILRRDNRHEKL